MPKVKFENNTVINDSYKDKKTGEQKPLKLQKAMLVFDDGGVMVTEVLLPRDGTPHAIGEYEIDDSSYFQDAYKKVCFRLTVGKPVHVTELKSVKSA